MTDRKGNEPAIIMPERMWVRPGSTGWVANHEPDDAVCTEYVRMDRFREVLDALNVYRIAADDAVVKLRNARARVGV